MKKGELIDNAVKKDGYEYLYDYHGMTYLVGDGYVMDYGIVSTDSKATNDAIERGFRNGLST